MLQRLLNAGVQIEFGKRTEPLVNVTNYAGC